MIPSDVASRLRLTTPDQPELPQATTPVKQLTDVLSDLVPGQRLMAEIQAVLPNGVYRAMIAQRDVTLALPFSAKTGDALELEIVESDGKLTLAFVANKTPGEKGSTESVTSTLSQTGRLIGNLLGSIGDQDKGSKATPLNGNQPLVAEFPKEASDLIPVLKDALTKSGMFYEAHQARWAEGKLPTEALLQEPQGKFSTVSHAEARTPEAAQGKSDGVLPGQEQRLTKDAAAIGAGSSLESQQKGTLQSSIPADLAPLVRQQLDALATQNYVWQGQMWPGQQVYWEIGEDGGDRPGAVENASRQWQTRLKLSLPQLGGIDAVMRLRGDGSIDVSLLTNSDSSRQRMIAAGEGLRRQLEDAGLNLTALAVQHGEIPG